MHNEIKFWYSHEEIKNIVGDIQLLKVIVANLKTVNQKPMEKYIEKQPPKLLKQWV